MKLLFSFLQKVEVLLSHRWSRCFLSDALRPVFLLEFTALCLGDEDACVVIEAAGEVVVGTWTACCTGLTTERREGSDLPEQARSRRYSRSTRGHYITPSRSCSPEAG